MFCAYKNNIWPHVCESDIDAPLANRLDESIVNPAGIYMNAMIPIHILDESQMVIVAMDTIEYIPLSMVLAFADNINDGHLLTFIKNKIRSLFINHINCLKDDCCFDDSNDIIKKSFSKRRWPVSKHSPIEWQKLVHPNNVSSNWMIRFVENIVKINKNTTDVELPYDFLEDLPNVKISDTLRDAVENGNIKTFVAIASKMETNAIINQYIMWIASADIPDKFHKMVTSFGAVQMSKQFGPNWMLKADKTYNVDVVHDLSNHVSILDKLYKLGMTNEYMTYLCTLMALPSYILILRETAIISHMKDLMEKNPIYTDMVAVAMSYSMYYATRIEQDTKRNFVTIDDPFVFTADMASAFPRFSNDPPGVNPYVQMGITNYDIFLPWLVINANRRIVSTNEAIERINKIAINTKLGKNFTKIVPWRSMKLSLTGSKMAAAASINPKEAMFKSMDEFVEKHYITAVECINKMMDIYKCNYNGEIVINIDSNTDGDNADNTMAKLYVDCKNFSDLDIAFHGAAEDYDKTACNLVKTFREHGAAFMIRREKHNSYSWMIFVEYLNYPIDLFHSPRRPIQLIHSFMTGYPRVYYDGLSVIMTSHYIVARLAGVNLTYNSLTLKDPCQIMFKSMTQELVTIMMSMYEKSVFEKWLKSKKIDQSPIYGNVTIKNPIFWINKETNFNPIDIESHWIKTTRTTPYSKRVINMFRSCNFIKPSCDMFYQYYNDLISNKNKKINT